MRSVAQLLAVPNGITVEQHAGAVLVESLARPQAQCPVLHRFAPGLYIREVSVPAGTRCVGHYQRERHLNILLKGKITILNTNGTLSLLVAPMMFVGEPGRKCGYVHEGMVWQNIYATDETDVEKLEARFLDKTQVWEDHRSMRLLTDTAQRTTDREDYLAVCDAYGYTAEQVQAQVQRTDDLIPFPEGTYKVALGPSPIHGKGLFATAPLLPGEPICLARLGGKRTPAGRYTNHSAAPNAVPVVLETGDVGLVALRYIRGCSGGALGEELTIDYRIALQMRGEEPLQ